VVETFEALLGKHLIKHSGAGSDDETVGASLSIRPTAFQERSAPAFHSGQVHPSSEV